MVGWLARVKGRPITYRLPAASSCHPSTRSALSCAPCAPQAQVIVSGVGDWRYVDCVSARAGKLAALEYVRSLYGISR